MRTIAVLAIFALLFGGALMIIDFDAIAQWAATEQRGFQNGMADAIRALRMGQIEALLALFAGAAAYGFFHAVGPGHGKALIGGVGLGTQVSASRLLLLSVASSLAQSFWAIVLVYCGFWILEVSANHMTALAEDFLAPLSYLAGALAVLVMGLGTASFTGLVAVSSVAARTAALASADNFKAAGVAFAGLQILTGLLVIWMSLSLLRYTL